MPKSLARLARYGAKYKVQIAFATACSVGNKICDLMPEILIGLVIEVVVHQRESPVAKLIHINNPFAQLYIIGTAIAAFWVLESISEYFYLILWHDIARKIQHQLRLETYAHMQSLDLCYFEENTTGNLLSIINDDVNHLENFLQSTPHEAVQLITNIIVMCFFFSYLTPILAICTLAPIPFVILIAYKFEHRLSVLYATIRQQSGLLIRHIASRIDSMLNIKSYATQAYELAQIEQENSNYQKILKITGQVNAIYMPTVRMGVLCGFTASLVIGGIYALHGKITLSSYSMLIFLTQRFLWPFITVANTTDLYEKCMASARRIFAILDTRPTIVDGHQHLPINLSGQIKFQQVNFTYPSGFTAIKNLCFEIPAKTTAAFVGSTGSGKSTIAKLLLRLYEPAAGQIMLDQFDIKTVAIQDLRQAIGLASQDIYLVDGTIAQNIKYGSFSATATEIESAAKLARAHDFIMRLRNGYDTVLTENGKNLSSGQRQCLSIARAILKNPAVYIFDEATSAVDNETELAIQTALNQLAQDHTMIIIAHRLSTVIHAQQIFVMEQGEIIETGTHTELLTRNGVYANLWRIQTGNATTTPFSAPVFPQ